MKVKNTSKVSVALDAELGLSLTPGEVMNLEGQLLEDALAIKGVVKFKAKEPSPSKGK